MGNSPGFTTSGYTTKDMLWSSPSRTKDSGTDAGDECQPAGNCRWTVPSAGPLTLLWTEQEKANDLAPTGIAPAAGATMMDIAGPISNGCETMPKACTRCVVCTTWERCSAAPWYDTRTVADSG